MAYDKQTWEDYPSTNTPISAERLNHMEQGIYDVSLNEINIISAYLANDVTLTMNVWPAKLPVTLHSSVENKLSINANNNIVVAEEVEKVKISANVCFKYAQFKDTDVMPGLKGIMINGINLDSGITQNSNYKTITIPSIILDTSTSKEIELRVVGNKDDIISGSNRDTYITVEVID